MMAAPMKIQVEMDEAWREWNERQQNPPPQEYDIVWADTTVRLVNRVNEKLREGWRVSGSVVIEGPKDYYQPIVREVR